MTQQNKLVTDINGVQYVAHNNEVLTLTQSAYVNDAGNYQAQAIDAKGAQYRVTWTALDTDSTNEDEACDWANYSIEEA